VAGLVPLHMEKHRTDHGRESEDHRAVGDRRGSRRAVPA
jgi:hypothetical protein